MKGLLLKELIASKAILRWYAFLFGGVLSLDLHRRR